MNLLELKETLLDTGLFYRTGSRGWYRLQECPYCGDLKRHMYVYIDLDNDTPVGYNCFKCNAHGIIDEKFMDAIGLGDLKIPKGKKRRRIDDSIITDVGDMIHGCDVRYIQDYIHQRVGVTPTMDDLISFNAIGDPFSYAREYLGGDMKGLRNRIWFRCGNGCMIGRSIHDDAGMRWLKYSGNAHVTDKYIYSIKKPFNTGSVVNLCIVEGVMDAIGLYYYQPMENPYYLACLGRNYSDAMMYALKRGIFGDSVCIRIFKDADVKQVSVDSKLSSFFKSVSVYRNILGKDYGVCADKIEIEKIKNY